MMTTPAPAPTRRVQDALRWAAGQLESTAEPRLAARLLLAHALACSTTDLFVHPERALTPEQWAEYRRLICRRARHEPVAYLIGHREFFGLDLLVDERVLIPRPETELLVECAIATAKPAAQNGPLRIIDVGTGSGAIAVSLAVHLPQAVIFATDASADALSVARANARRQRVAERITFLKGDLLAPLTTPVEIIVANLPYVGEREYAALPPNIRLYEPRRALIAGDDGLKAIRTLFSQARAHLAAQGVVLVEIGAQQGAAVSTWAARVFPNARIAVHPDYAGLDRIVECVVTTR